MTDFLGDADFPKGMVARAVFSLRHPDADKEQNAKYRAVHKDTPEYKKKNREGARRWREDNPERAKTSAENFRAKPENREKARIKTREWSAANPERVKAWSLANYHANRDMHIAKVIKWQRDNPGKVRVRFNNYRARKLANGGTLSPNLVETLMKQQKSKCVACAVKLTAKNRHLDHIISLKAGGPNIDFNCQLLCASCNCSKRAKDPLVFMRSKGFLL